MDKMILRTNLPWRRVVPGTHGATAPTGETYVVKQTSEGWEVSVREDGGKAKVIGDDVTKLLWMGKCRAEHHYTQKTKHAAKPTPSAPSAKPAKEAPKPKPERTAPSKNRTPSGKEAKGPRRKRRGAGNAVTSAKPSTRAPGPGKSPAQPVAPKSTPKSPGVSVPVETPLSWTTQKLDGRSACVAEYPGGTLKIVKTADFHTLVRDDSEPLACGSLCEMKNRADEFAQESQPVSAGRASKKGSEEKIEVGVVEKPSKPKPSAAPKPARPKVVDTTATTVDAKKDAAIVNGLRDLLGGLKPPAKGA